MKTLLFVVLIVVGLAIFAVYMAKKNRSSENLDEKPPYFRKKTLLNEKEQVLFHRLVEAMPNCYVMAQVRLADIIGVKKCKNWQAWFNKVNRKSVDFVICNKSLEVLACIELDGKMHEQENRQKADKDKDAVLNAAGIPIIRIEANKLASIDEIKSLLEKTLLHKAPHPVR